jgi:hypothetical protein
MRYRAAAIRLTRPEDALKQLEPTTGVSCPHSDVVMFSANAASFLKKMIEDAMTFIFLQEKSLEKYVVAG